MFDAETWKAAVALRREKAAALLAQQQAEEAIIAEAFQYVDLYSLDLAGNPQLSSLSPSKPLNKERAYLTASDWAAGV